MARTLDSPPPSSSMAPLLDVSAAQRAITAPRLQPQAAALSLTTATRVARKLNEPTTRFVKRELTLDRAADAMLTDLIQLLRTATDTRLTASHVVRATLRAIAACRPALEHEAHRLGPMKLPSNASGRERERDEFEQRIADAVLRGMQSSLSALNCELE